MPHGQDRKMIKKLHFVPVFVQKFSFPSQNETCLVDFEVLELTLTSGQLFYRAIYLET